METSGRGLSEEMLTICGYVVSWSKHGITRAGRHTSHGFGIKTSRRYSSGHRIALEARASREPGRAW